MQTDIWKQKAELWLHVEEEAEGRIIKEHEGLPW